MAPILTVKVLAASAGLSPILQASHWEGRIAAIFQTSLHLAVHRLHPAPVIASKAKQSHPHQARDCFVAPLLAMTETRGSGERLRQDLPGPYGALLHLQGGALLASPFSLRIESSLATLIKYLPLVKGMPVNKEGSCIELPGRLHLSLGEVLYYRSSVVVLGNVDPEALRIAKQILTIEGRPGGFDAIPGTTAVAVAIHKALTDGVPDRLLSATRQIIGLGPGLTPSGDDFLVGCLKGLWLLAGREPGLHNLIGCLRSNLALDLSDHTTRIGAEFIRCALKGQFAEVLDRAAEALLMPAKPEDVVSAISQLVAQGETSGTDTTRGLLTCLDALLHIPCWFEPSGGLDPYPRRPFVGA